MADLSPKTTLNTRFSPTEKPRQVVESSTIHPTKLASQVGFSPVATMNLGDNKIYVRPVKNTNSRAVSLGVVGSSGQVAVHGERSISLTADMHNQLKTHTSRAVENYVSQKPSSQTTQKYISPEDLMPEHFVKVPSNSVQQAPVLIKPNAVVTPTPTTSLQPTSTKEISTLHNEQLKTQLEQINSMLFEQIKQKIASELARQQKEIDPHKTPVTVAPKLEDKPQATIPTASPVVVQNKPQETTTATQVPPQTKPQEELKQKLERPIVKTAIPTLWEQKTPVVPASAQNFVKKIGPGSDQFKSQIDHLEGEIKILVKEVEGLDKTVKSLETEKNNSELTTLERRIEVDQKMLAAVAEWRMALNNLINSHSIAIKYLKEKTDWLEEQASHELKHNNQHKPLKIFAGTEQFWNQEQLATQPAVPNPEQIVVAPFVKETAVPTNIVVAKDAVTNQAVENQPTQLNAQLNLKPPTETQNSSVPKLNIEANLITREVKPGEISTNQPTFVVEKEVQAPSFEAVRDMVKQAMEKENQPLQHVKPEVRQIQPDINAVRNLVKGVLNEELPKAAPASIQPNQVNTVYVKEVDKATVIPENSQTGVIIKEQPIISSVAPIINLTTADIEKQILEQAEKDEAVKETIRKAKELAQQKIQEETDKKEQAVAQAAKQSSNTQLKISEPSQEMIKAGVAKLKASLTTIDHNQLASFSKDQRTEMIRKLENLEKDTLISKQFDEIKATSERRRINTELSAMLHQLGQKPPETLPANQNPQQRIQTLKVEEKKQTSPAQKAHLIAEIKELERQTQARKAVELSRPTVKAQPAFGKMLPNTPTVPNVINGIVKDPKGLLLSTVVIIVKDSKGDPVRAFKTNKIGQFALSTPVPNGVYTLELEKNGYEFDLIEVDVNGAIMQPIEIKAR